MKQPENLDDKPVKGVTVGTIIEIDKIQPNSAIILQCTEEFDDVLMQVLQAIGQRYGAKLRAKGCIMLALKKGNGLETVDEKWMNKQGWFRKSENRIITPENF